MKQPIILILFFCLSYSLTTKAEDVINYKGQQYPLQSLPLMQHPKSAILDTEISHITGERSFVGNSYQIVWEVLNDHIYLTEIRSYADRKIKVDLSKLFGNSYKNGKVKADWINEKLYIQQGKELHYDKSTGLIFQWEVELTVTNGKVFNTRWLDNNGTRISKYTTQPEITYNLIHKNIRWKNIPDLGEKEINIPISILTTGTLKPEVSLLRNKNDLYSAEALRVAKLLPEWDVYYKRGEPVIKSFAIRVKFSEENRRKYSNSSK